MANRQAPINKAYDKNEAKSAAEAAGGTLSQAAQSALDKKPRLWHRRGRFTVPEQVLSYLEIHTDPNTHEELLRNEGEYRYYEKVEVTEDTYRNPRFKPKKGKDPKAIVDDGGDFTHYTIEYLDVTTEDRTGSFAGETLEIQRAGYIWLYPPYNFEHDGIQVSESIKPPEEDLDLSAIGPKLWKELNPTKPAVGLGVNIAEVKDLPRLVKGRLDSLKSLVSSVTNPKGLADWLLAVQFGWKPLLADIRKCIKLYYRLESRIQFLMRNGGVPLHRATPAREPIVTVETLYEYTGSENQGWMDDIIPFGSDVDEDEERFQCKIVLTKRVYEKASGVFTYHLGDIPPTPAYLRLKLLGLIANESLLWEATKWSWLVDWFSNMGDVISNIEASLKDRVVALYAYSQRRIVREYKFTCSNGFYDCSVTRVFDTQCRRKIDPFGLASEVSLSDLQLGILVALGLTRV